MANVEQIRLKYEHLAPFMDERLTRLWAAAEAKALGRGGAALVTEATGIRCKRLSAGKQDLEALDLEGPGETYRIRRPGGGRKRAKERDPGLLAALDALIDPVTRGDPQSPLRWTCKSLRKLSAELTEQGHPVSAPTVRLMLKEMGYSLQANRKTREGAQHPDRDAQFRYINRRVKTLQGQGQPVISVDTKKKELVGDFKNGGREWHRQGMPEPVRVHDFLDPGLGKAIPYGVYDLQRNEGWVSVGVNHDTSAFAVESIRRWWRQMGRRSYPDASELLITADGGGRCGGELKVLSFLTDPLVIGRILGHLGMPTTAPSTEPARVAWESSLWDGTDTDWDEGGLERAPPSR